MPSTRFLHHDQVAETGSTNRDLAEWAASVTEPVGRVLVADHQTRGRGRRVRTWTAPPGSSLAISACFWPRRAENHTWLPLLTGLAVLRAVRQAAMPDESAHRVVLKWPNDVLVVGEPGPGKLCGILTERVHTLHGPAVVLGIGINTAMTAEQRPVPTATSLALAGGTVTTETLVDAIIAALDDLIDQWESGADLRSSYAAECASIGAELRVQLGQGRELFGKGVGVDDLGRLLLQTPQGSERISAGDVEHVRLA